MNNPMTMSCIWIDLEKQIVLLANRLIRVRNVARPQKQLPSPLTTGIPSPPFAGF
jgi:hypothetical protein